MKKMLVICFALGLFPLVLHAQTGSADITNITKLKQAMTNEGWNTYWDNPAHKDEFITKLKSGIVMQHIVDISKDKYYRLYLLDYIVEARKEISIDNKTLIYDQINQIYINKNEDSEIRGTAIMTVSFLLYDLRENKKTDANYIDATVKTIIETIKSTNETKFLKISSIRAIKELFYTNASPDLLNILQHYYRQDDIELSRSLVVTLGDFKYTPVIPILVDILQHTKAEDLFGSTAYSLGLFGNYDCLVAILNNARRFPDNYSCDYILNDNRAYILNLLNSSDGIKSTFALHASQYLFKQEELIPQYLNILQKGNTEQKRFIVDRLSIINDKNGLIEAVKILETEKDQIIIDKLKVINQWLNADQLESKESTIKIPDQSKYNITTQEVADGMFRQLSNTLDVNFNHAAVYLGLNSSGYHKVIAAVGGSLPVSIVDLSTMTNDGFNIYYGSYNLNNTSLSFSNRQSILSTANALVNANIAYPSLTELINALTYYSGTIGTISISDIYKLRCDGVLEYCYELNGFSVWGPGSGYNYNISYSTSYCDAHNYWGGFTPYYQRGGAGNTNTYMTWAATTAPPTCTATQSYVNGGTQVSISATDQGSGIHWILYSLDGGSNFSTSPRQVNYPASPSYTYIIPSLVTSSTTVYYRAVDNGGNYQSTALSISVTADNTAPTGSISINSNAAYTNTTSVTLTLSASDAQSGVSQMQFSNDGVTWSSWETYGTSKSWILTTGDGSKTVYVRFKDVVGNISASYSDIIILDATAPSSGTISINSGAASTTSLIVSLNNLSAYDALSLVYQMHFSNNNSTWSSWETYASTKSSWDLSSYGGTTSLGTKTTYVQYRDNAGNTSSSYSDNINYTTTTPVAPTVTTTEASSIAQTTAASGGNVTSDGGSSVTARGVCWSTSSNPTTSNSHTSDGTGIGVFTSSITGLAPGTTYHIRAYATNSVNTSYGSDLTFTTTTTTPVAPTVTTTEASSITTTTATSGGNVTSDGGSSVTARGVCWSTSSNPTTSNSHTSDGSGIGVFTSSITGLAPGTTYHIRAYATNSINTSYGSDLTFTTATGGTTVPGDTIYSIPYPGPDTSTVYGLAFDGIDTLYVSEFYGTVIYKINPLTGQVYSTIPTPENKITDITWMREPGYIPYLLIHASTSHLIYTIDKAGVVIYIDDSPAKQYPTGLCYIPGSLWTQVWVVDRDAQKAYLWNWNTISITDSFSMPIQEPMGPRCLAYDTANATLLQVISDFSIVDAPRTTLYEINKTNFSLTGNSLAFPAPLDGDITNGRGVEYDPRDGNYWVACQHVGRIYKIRGFHPLGINTNEYIVDAPNSNQIMLFKCYPNPVGRYATFTFNLPKSGPYMLKVYNIAGQLVHCTSGQGKDGMNNVTWNASKISAGVYFYNLNYGGQSVTKKMVVVK